MELSRSLSLLRLSPSSTCTSSASSSSSCPSFRPSSSSPAASFQKLRRRQPWRRSAVKAAAEGGGDTVERISGGDSRFGGAAMEISPAPASGSSSSSSVIERSFSRGEADGAVWEKLEAIVRLSYGIGVYGAMAMAGNVICSVTGVDPAGGFQFSLNAIVEGLGYAAPPIMALLFILDDEVVKHSPYARAIRDVEDEELRSFFYGMSPWQFLLIVSASSVGEGLFYRAAIQGSLADVFLRSTDLMKDAHGIASLTGMLPVFVPFAQAFAAATTAALTGSLYYVATTPKDPTYVVAPVLRNRAGREDMKKLFAAWYERRQLKKIYSPLLEGLLALYLGFEWIQTGNMLAPMITHGIYSAVVLGHGLWKIHYHRRRLRHRTQLVRPLLPLSKTEFPTTTAAAASH